MKRILFIMQPDCGGAGKSFISEYKAEKASGNQVEMIEIAMPFSCYLLAPIYGVFFRGETKRIKEAVLDFNPDETRAYHFSAIVSHRIAQKFDIPFTYYLRDETNFGLWDRLCLPFFKRIIYAPFLSFYQKKQAEILHKSQKIISNSKYMAALCKNLFNRDSVLSYPRIEQNNIVQGATDPVYIGMVGGSRLKGIDIFIDIAKALPEEKFLVVTPKKLKLPPNIEQMEWGDVRDFYKQLRLLLVPSRWEPYGRVAVEAKMSGIPVLASHTGGLPETGCETVEDYTNPNAWVERIKAKIGSHA